MADIAETDRVIDPCRGEGAIYDNLPTCLKLWCEITEGREFFNYDEEADIIVCNPPFSLLTRWLYKSIYINPKKMVFVIGLLNLSLFF